MKLKTVLKFPLTHKKYMIKINYRDHIWICFSVTNHHDKIKHAGEILQVDMFAVGDLGNLGVKVTCWLEKNSCLYRIDLHTLKNTVLYIAKQ